MVFVCMHCIPILSCVRKTLLVKQPSRKSFLVWNQDVLVSLLHILAPLFLWQFSVSSCYLNFKFIKGPSSMKLTSSHNKWWTRGFSTQREIFSDKSKTFRKKILIFSPTIICWLLCRFFRTRQRISNDSSSAIYAAFSCSKLCIKAPGWKEQTHSYRIGTHCSDPFSEKQLSFWSFLLPECLTFALCRCVPAKSSSKTFMSKQLTHE